MPLLIIFVLETILTKRPAQQPTLLRLFHHSLHCRTLNLQEKNGSLNQSFQSLLKKLTEMATQLLQRPLAIVLLLAAILYALLIRQALVTLVALLLIRKTWNKFFTIYSQYNFFTASSSS